MTPAAIFHPDAERELQEARAWYESQRLGLGDEFVTAVEACISKIQESPMSFPVVLNGIRRAKLRRFRAYSIMYEPVSPQTLYVYSVFHGSRDPRTWRRRLR